MLTKLRRSIAWVSGLKLEMEIEHLQKRGRKFDIPRKRGRTRGKFHKLNLLH